MARRDRVPRHKSHNHKKNQNPKLSPFQREQKRTKLANQAPTARDSDDLNAIPHSQRRVYQYLMEKKARDDARRQRQREAQEAEERGSEAEDEEAVEDVVVETAGCTATSKGTSRGKGEDLEDESDVEEEETAGATASGASSETAAPVMSNKQRKKLSKNRFATVASLNAEVLDEVAPARRLSAAKATAVDGNGEPALTLEERIAKKKEKKHERKSELRRQRVTEKMENMERELLSLVRGKKKKGPQDENLAFERKLRLMQTERAREVKAAKEQEKVAANTSRKRQRDASASFSENAGEHDVEGDGTDRPSRKRISFDDSVEQQVHRDANGTELPHEAMRFPKDNRGRRGGDGFAKPTDFYEMVDIVRFGERVEAPPVFDVVPNRNAAITRLANKLSAEEEASGSKRYRLLSGGGGLGEQKRLARMGLAPAITGTITAGSEGARRGLGRNAAAAMDKDAIKSREMSQLREHVVAAYQKKKRSDVENRKGVNMKHEFPRFS